MADPKTGTGQETDPGTVTPQGTEGAADKGTTAGDKTMTDEAAALLKENMKMKRRLKELETEANAKTEAEAKEKGQFKELYEKTTGQVKALEARLIKAELLANLPGLIKPDLVKLIDLSGITVVDGEPVGVQEVAQAFAAANPEFFTTTDGAVKVPPTPKPKAPGNTPGPQSFKELMEMPGQHRQEWIAKNPAAYKALCEAGKP